MSDDLSSSFFDIDYFFNCVFLRLHISFSYSCISWNRNWNTPSHCLVIYDGIICLLFGVHRSSNLSFSNYWSLNNSLFNDWLRNHFLGDDRLLHHFSLDHRLRNDFLGLHDLRRRKVNVFFHLCFKRSLGLTCLLELNQSTALCFILQSN